MKEGFLRQWAMANASGVRSDRPASPAQFLGLTFDTRTVDPGDPKPLAFVALRGDWRDGHMHLADAHKRGVRTFLVEADPGPSVLPESLVIVLNGGTLAGLQALAGAWRASLPVQVVGVTGSNGKTIVKEWLSTLLGDDVNVYRSPRSFNSQLGVPVALWGLRPEHDIAIIEVGISEPGEMVRLAACVQPDFGVLTHLGDAHLEAFGDEAALRAEKLSLFAGCKWVVMPDSLSDAAEDLRNRGVAVRTWGQSGSAEWQVTSDSNSDEHRSFQVIGHPGQWRLPARGEIAFRNALTALSAAWALGRSADARLAHRMLALRDLDMRMQRLQTPDGHWVLSDAWTNDWGALTLALEDLRNLPGNQPKALVLGPLPMMDALTASRLQQLARSERLDRVWLVGEAWADMQAGQLETKRFADVDAALQHLRAHPDALQGHDILVKGPRRAAFERISERLIRNGHATTLTIDLEAVTTNLRTLRHHVEAAIDKPVEFMAVVKASAYGASAVAISHALRRQGVRRFAVACTEEGVELRQSGLEGTIVVFNPDPGTFAAMVDHDLEPELHSLGQIQSLLPHLRATGKSRYPVHLKLDTGMHRLGFSADNLQPFLDAWSDNGWSEWLRLESVFSHLASADDPAQDAFTRGQIATFNTAVITLRNALGPAQPLRSHILNSAGAIRFPDAAGDWIRLGIALYGISGHGAVRLQPALSFETVVSALRDLPASEGLGYGHTDAAPHERRIATLPVGYADGWPRHLSHGTGWVNIHGAAAPVVGKVCMDMTLVDVTNIPGVQEGDEVILFGESPTIEEIAQAADTIPYEILSRIPQRVRRLQKGG
jgi:alanine racemase